MKTFTRIYILAGLMALAILINPVVTHAQNYNDRGCAWPLLLSPEGPANVQGPDSAARYWIMPFDTTQYQTMTIKGTYPNARYFSIVAYNTVGTSGGGYTFEVADQDHPLYDAKIAPDGGSINPFVPPGGRNGTYTVLISRTTPPGSGNTIAVSSDLVWVVLRLYVADADPSLGGQSLMGGVPLPTITVTDKNSESQELETCSPINKWLDLSTFAQYLFPPEVDLVVNEGTPSSNRLWFASPLNPPGVFWPNPDGKYMMMMPGNEYQRGRIIVIHGKAPGFPDTFDGSPIWVPSTGFRHVDLRYWAVCNMNLVSPPSLVDCATDLTTRLIGGYYTIVISDDRQRPDWLNPNVNWLPWGDQYPKFVVLRNMLPAPNFQHAVQDAWEYNKHECTFDFTFPDIPERDVLDTAGPCAQRVMGDYYPVALWCDKATFLRGGFRACLKDGD